VSIHVDTFGRDYYGTVENLPGAAGTLFSLLPPENASGNFVTSHSHADWLRSRLKSVLVVRWNRLERSRAFRISWYDDPDSLRSLRRPGSANRLALPLAQFSFICLRQFVKTADCFSWPGARS